MVKALEKDWKNKKKKKVLEFISLSYFLKVDL